MRLKQPGESFATVVLHQPDAREKMLYCLVVLSLTVAAAAMLTGLATVVAGGDWAFGVLLGVSSLAWICASLAILQRMESGWIVAGRAGSTKRLRRRFHKPGMQATLTLEPSDDRLIVRCGSHRIEVPQTLCERDADRIGLLPMGRYQGQVIHRLLWTAAGPMRFAHLPVAGAPVPQGSVRHHGLLYSPCTPGAFIGELEATLPSGVVRSDSGGPED